VIEKATRYGAQLGGAKGVPDESIKQAIKQGIAKINIDTDIRLAFTATIREVIATAPTQFDPREILGPARDAMRDLVRSKLRLFESSGKALMRKYFCLQTSRSRASSNGRVFLLHVYFETPSNVRHAVLHSVE
jgi:hypothetical protein